MAQPFDIEQRWPALLLQLDSTPDRAVEQPLAYASNEGWEPVQEDVEDLAKEARGDINGMEYLRRAGVVAKRRRMSNRQDQ